MISPGEGDKLIPELQNQLQSSKLFICLYIEYIHILILNIAIVKQC
jgi:hypothetical protein